MVSDYRIGTWRLYGKLVRGVPSEQLGSRGPPKARGSHVVYGSSILALGTELKELSA